jgi:hypothetical protein
MTLLRAVEAVPEDTGIGAVPDSMAKAASVRIRPAWDQDSRICAALVTCDVRGLRRRMRARPKANRAREAEPTQHAHANVCAC